MSRAASRGAYSRQRPQTNWVIDRHIPVALILAVLLQTAGGVWWVATMNSRVSALEVASTASMPIEGRLTRLETKFESIQTDLAEIKGLLRERGRVPTVQVMPRGRD